MLLTYGHGTESAERSVATLAGAGIASLVDIRTAPGHDAGQPTLL
jgi:hypothetical protein